MPTFPTYLRDQTPTPPGVPGVDIGVGAAVAGVNKLAAGVGQAADYAEQAQTRLDKQSMFDDNVKTDRYRVQTENDIKEWQKNIPENATGMPTMGISPSLGWAIRRMPERVAVCASFSTVEDALGVVAVKGVSDQQPSMVTPVQELSVNAV